MQAEAFRLDGELIELGLVDDAEDLADIVVVEGHQPPAPNLLKISDTAAEGAGARASLLARPVTGRDWRMKSSPVWSKAHSMSWGEPKCFSTRLATSTTPLLAAGSREGAWRRSSSTSTRWAPSWDATYSRGLSLIVCLTTSPVTLETR